MALAGLVGELTDWSRIHSDLTAEPPRIELDGATVAILHGEKDTESGGFVTHGQSYSLGHHAVSGTYTGPGSVLTYRAL